MFPMNPLIPYHFVRATWAFRHFRDGDPSVRLKEYQDRRARRIVAYAAKHSPFYRRHWDGCNLADWKNLPTIDKAVMMENFGEFNTRGVTRDAAFTVALNSERGRDFTQTLHGNLTVGLSSGTSGHRGAFLVSPSETAAWAGTVLQRVLHRLPKRGYRIAFFLRSNSNLYERVGGRVRFRWFDLMTPVLEAVSALNVYAPDLLVGPPSLLLSLAEMHRRGLLTIRPDRLISVAETLEAQDKVELEAVFGVPVGQVYQCTEGFLAATCPEGRLHLNEDMVAVQYKQLVESEREPGNHTASSEKRRVTPVITDLWRTTQPIIRYHLGDVLTLDDGFGPCPCGSRFQVIHSIEGRCDDVCIFPDISTGTPRRFYPDTIRRMILLADGRITDYAAIQDVPGRLAVHISVTEETKFAEVRDKVQQSAEEVLAQYECRATHLEIHQGLLPTAPGAKRRRVICLVRDAGRATAESSGTYLIKYSKSPDESPTARRSK